MDSHKVKHYTKKILYLYILQEQPHDRHPTSLGAKLEWSKTYALDIVEKLAPDMIIKNFNISTEEELRQAIDNYTDD